MTTITESTAAAYEAAHGFAAEYAAGLVESESFHAALMFTEARALARILLAAGAPNMAAGLIESWAQNTDPRDMAEQVDEVREFVSVIKNADGYLDQYGPLTFYWSAFLIEAAEA